MAYDREFLKLSWLFTVNTTTEIAMTSVNLSVIPVWTGALAALEEIDDLSTGLGQELINNMATLLGTTGLNWAGFSVLRDVRLAAVGMDGAELADALEFTDTTPPVGTSATTELQDTVCASLRSGSTFGSANFGRMYLPHTRLSRGSGPTSDSSVTGPIATAFRLMLNTCTSQINVLTTPTVQPFIMGNQAPKPSKPVINVAIGNVTDTQRRRRNQVQETYSVLTLI